MQVLFITPEALPFSRVGGLGDVSFYLPRALAHRGYGVIEVLPKLRGPDKMKLAEIYGWHSEIDMYIST